jgi:hypothetical protein
MSQGKRFAPVERLVMSLWLAKDQKSNEVAALQNALNLRLKPAQPLALDGIFGPLTKAAVSELQKCENLKVDGIAGPQTLGALFVHRTVTHTFVLTMGAPPAGEANVDASRRSIQVVGSPYDPPSLPPHPQPEPGVSALLERWRAWQRAYPPKPEVPEAPPPLPSLQPDDKGSTKNEPPGFGRKWRLDGEHPRRFEVFAKNEWLELEYATEFSKKLHHKLQIVQVLTAAFVKGAPYIVPSVSAVLSPGGESGLRASVRILDRPIIEREWKGMTGEAGAAGRLWLAPALVTSLMWPYGQKDVSFDIFAGLRLGASWSKEWRGVRGRVHVLTLSAGIAAGNLIVGENEGKGRFRINPLVGVETGMGVSYAVGPRERD